jgi:hypothetical protein
MRGAAWVFRLDRIADPVATDEIAPPRRLAPEELPILPGLRVPTLD